MLVRALRAAARARSRVRARSRSKPHRLSHRPGPPPPSLSQGHEILVENVWKGDDATSVHRVASMITTLCQNALGGSAVCAGQICDWAPESLMPMSMLVEPRAADAARFFSDCVTDHGHDYPALLLFVPIANIPDAVRAAGKVAIHDYLRDTILPDFASHPPAAQGQLGRAGSAAVSAAYEFRQGA